MRLFFSTIATICLCFFMLMLNSQEAAKASQDNIVSVENCNENTVLVCSIGAITKNIKVPEYVNEFIKSNIVEQKNIYEIRPVITIHTEKVIGEPTLTPKATSKPKLTSTIIPVSYTEMDVPYDTANFKAYMPYTALSSNSKQGILQKKAVTGKYGIRYVDGRMCVAVGTYYGLTGTKLDITLSNGTIMYCIVGDSKSDHHTDSSHRVCQGNGSIVEFIVDSSTMDSKAKCAGSYSALSEFSGRIIKIQKLD